MNTLSILWSTADVDVFMRVILMYAINSKKEGWWQNVEIIIWGPSARIAGENPLVQTEIMELIHAGVVVEACKVCSDSYGTSEKLGKMGVDVKFMGEPLTSKLKSGVKVLTF